LADWKVWAERDDEFMELWRWTLFRDGEPVYRSGRAFGTVEEALDEAVREQQAISDASVQPIT
jgi:hypothetical protein